MGKMISPLGHIDFEPLEFHREADKFVVRGKAGMWEAKFYFTPQEVLRLLRLFISFSVLGYIIVLPFLYFRSLSHHKKEHDKGQRVN
ncbi:MAG: hypothetical protein OS130_13775 [Thermodesulfobacteriota bacterium]|jgi:hypothetical protein|nr:MAG: hypothetical protein OS130_13775 [Thermodesulfobacteriota bacterium]